MNCTRCGQEISSGVVKYKGDSYHASCAVLAANGGTDPYPVRGDDYQEEIYGEHTDGSRGGKESDEGRTLDTADTLVH